MKLYVATLEIETLVWAKDEAAARLVMQEEGVLREEFTHMSDEDADLRLATYLPAMYDGSEIAWGDNDEKPVEDRLREMLTNPDLGLDPRQRSRPL